MTEAGLAVCPSRKSACQYLFRLANLLTRQTDGQTGQCLIFWLKNESSIQDFPNAYTIHLFIYIFTWNNYVLAHSPSVSPSTSPPTSFSPNFPGLHRLRRHLKLHSTGAVNRIVAPVSEVILLVFLNCEISTPKAVRHLRWVVVLGSVSSNSFFGDKFLDCSGTPSLSARRTNSQHRAPPHTFVSLLKSQVENLDLDIIEGIYLFISSMSRVQPFVKSIKSEYFLGQQS